MSRMTDNIQNDLVPRLGVRFGLVLILTLACVGLAVAQDGDEVVRVDTDLVAFEVSVSDKNGNPVRNLRAEDFRVFEDGIERSIDFFQPVKKVDESRPLSVVFTLDVSGSMTDAEIERLRSAMQSFIARLANYESYFAVVSFAMEVR